MPSFLSVVSSSFCHFFAPKASAYEPLTCNVEEEIAPLGTEQPPPMSASCIQLQKSLDSKSIAGLSLCHG